MKRFSKILSIFLCVVLCFCIVTIPARAEVVTLALVTGVLFVTAVLASLAISYGLQDDGGLRDLVDEAAADAVVDGVASEQGYVTAYRDPANGGLYLTQTIMNWFMNWLRDRGAFTAPAVSAPGTSLTPGTYYTTSSPGYMSVSSCLDYLYSIYGYPSMLNRSYFANHTFCAWFYNEANESIVFYSTPAIALYCSSVSSVRPLNENPYVDINSVVRGYSYTFFNNANTVPTRSTTQSQKTYGAAPYIWFYNIGSDAVVGSNGVIVGENVPDFNLTDPLDVFVDWGGLSVDGTDATTDNQDVVYPGVFPLVVTQDPYAVFDFTQDQVQMVDTALEGTPAAEIEQVTDLVTYEDADYYAVDLVSIFPFCIPFDIYHMIQLFDAEPVAPSFQIPFNVPAANLEYTFDLDFSGFDSVAQILRTMEVILFCVGLALLTAKVIKW